MVENIDWNQILLLGYYKGYKISILKVKDKKKNHLTECE